MRFVNFITGGRPPGSSGFAVAERWGCNLNPINATTNKGRLTLLACVFPDEFERYGLLEEAMEVTRRTPAVVERADLAGWIAAQLGEPRPRLATVVFHTIVSPYLPDDVREAAEATLPATGERATAEAPLALLAFEGSEDAAGTHPNAPDAVARRTARAAGEIGAPFHHGALALSGVRRRAAGGQRLRVLRRPLALAASGAGLSVITRVSGLVVGSVASLVAAGTS